MWAPIPVGVADVLAPLVDGPINFVVNGTLNRQYRGPCWGTFGLFDSRARRAVGVG